MSYSVTIAHVWCYNVREELRKLDYALKKFPVVSIDTEFPGFLQCSPRHCSDVQKYLDLKVNVDATKLIQLGLTLSDEEGKIGGVWQFNFNFSTDINAYSNDSIEFLRMSGIDFERLKKDGIDGYIFSNLLACILRRHQHLQWVCFHGLYDLAHLLKLLIKKPLPNSLVNFTRLVGCVFGEIVDIKYMARLCKGLLEGELGLQKLGEIMKVERRGQAHQAGSDSLLTAQLFAKMKYNCQHEESEYLGKLYGIHANICRPHQRLQAPTQVISSIPYCQPRPKIIFIRPLPPPVVCSPYAMHPVHMVNRHMLLL